MFFLELQSEILSLSGGVHHWLKRGTREKKTCDKMMTMMIMMMMIIIIIIIICELGSTG
jgi:hypothetical protein